MKSSTLPGNKAKWKKIKKLLVSGEGRQGERNVLEFHAKVRLVQFVFNRGKLICIKCEIISIHHNKSNEVVEIEPLNKHTHITVGCFPPTKPVESNATLEELYGDDSKQIKQDGVYEVGEDVIEVKKLTTDVVLENQKLFVYY